MSNHAPDVHPSRGNKTLDMEIHIRHLNDDAVQAVLDAINDAVVGVTGMVPSQSWTVKPDYAGPGRTPEEEAKAREEGRR